VDRESNLDRCVESFDAAGAKRRLHIAVPTPINAEKAPVLDSVFTAVRAIAPLL